MKLKSSIFAIMAMCIASGAHAKVRYQFTTNASPGTYDTRVGYGNFTLTTNNYISRYGGIPASGFDSCTVIQPASASCLIAYFNPRTGNGYSTMQFVGESAAGDWYSYQWLFPGGALSSPGTYKSIVNPFDPISRTVVYTLRVSTVPEPASWAMMIGGFGAMGAALRRRRRTGQISRGGIAASAHGG